MFVNKSQVALERKFQNAGEPSFLTDEKQAQNFHSIKALLNLPTLKKNKKTHLATSFLFGFNISD